MSNAAGISARLVATACGAEEDCRNKAVILMMRQSPPVSQSQFGNKPSGNRSSIFKLMGLITG
jgi:hypothetical protein